MLLCILNILDLTNFKFTEIPVYFPKKEGYGSKTRTTINNFPIV